MTAKAPLTIFTARKVITMDDSMPEATAVAVIGDRIVSVGDASSMQAWRDGREVCVDERLRDKVLLPGLIDNHAHPFLGALLLPCEIIAPEDWRRPDGSVSRAAPNEREYRGRLEAWVGARRGKDEWLVSWGYQPRLHGRLTRRVLDELCPDTPLVIQQRSFHEVYANTKAIEAVGITPESVAGNRQVDLDNGHFFETGRWLIMHRMMPYFLRKEWYHRGLGMLAQLCHQGGVTTIGDQLFGAIDPEYELGAIDAEIESKRLPLRIVNVSDARTFSNRAAGLAIGPPDRPIPFERGLEAIESMLGRGTRHVKFARGVKLFADGAMFSQLMQLNAPGYADGHRGEWLMSPEVLTEGVRTFWNAGFQVNVHVNGDGGMDAVLAALERVQRDNPRFDHRFTVHHLGFHASAQTRRLAALGAVASVNPYYIHALADSYSLFGMGTDRASQIVRAGSLVRAGVPVSLHSDYPMAPIEPLFLAWCAMTRRTAAGRVASPSERLTLQQGLRGVTIDAAFALGLDHEIGSIAAGKKADFTVLEADPFEVGEERLKDIAIWGTVFEGEVRPLRSPAASVHAARQSMSPSWGSSSARSMDPRCCAGAGDHCGVIRDFAAWARDALLGNPLRNASTT
jgi:predicted amidohydrolase YtcJ